MPHEITIDQSGRLVIPKDVRELHQLKAGSRLTLLDEDDRLVLVPHDREPKLLDRDGLLVVSASGEDDIPDHRTLRDQRLERLSPYA